MSSNEQAQIGLQISFIAIFFGGAFVLSGLKRYFQARQSADNSTSKIATAAQGFVELQGHAWPDSNKSLISLNGQSCVYLHLIVQKQVRSGKNRKWETVGTFEEPDRFYLLDSTGCVLVRAQDFDKEFRSKRCSWSSLSVAARERVLSLVKFRESLMSTPDLQPGWFSASYRVTQRYLVLGNPVLAHGRLRLDRSSGDSIHHQAMGRFFVELKNHNKLRRNFDLNRDGEVSEGESASGFHVMATQAVSGSQVSGVPIPFFGVLERHEQLSSFLVDCHQEHFLKRVGVGNFLKIVGGCGLIIFGIKVLLTNLFGL